MVAKRKSKNASPIEQTGQDSVQLERLARLLALLVVKGESQVEKMRVLASTGFTNTEIAELLGVTANAVAITLHRIRSKK